MEYYLYQYLIICIFVLALLILNTFRNSLIFHKVHSDTKQLNTEPFISILVPARNEEANIRACIESLCNQSYSHYQVIVLNDNSTDNTEYILNDLLTIYPTRLTVLSGKSLPQNWVGKPYACHQLYEASQGDYLFFTDADTIHSSECLHSIIHHAQKHHVDMLSIVPHQIMENFWEHVAIPFIHTLYLTYLPHDLILDSDNPAFAAANGQALLFKRSAYEAIGGHRAVFNSIAEDIDMAILMKKAKRRLCHSSGSAIIQCRMYRTSKEVFQGFSKNSFATMQFSGFKLAFFVTHLFATYIVPLLISVYAILVLNIELLSISLIALSLLFSLRMIIALYFKSPLYHIVLHPLTAFSFIIMSLNSALLYAQKKGTVWKDRSYVLTETSIT